MSIVNQIEDAQFLIKHHKYKSALTLILLAIAASSRKALPKGTKSIKDSKKNMGDGEAFALFLGGRLQRLHNFDIGGDKAKKSVCSVFDKTGETQLIEEAIYKYYRCFLIHEGDLPPNVEFIDNITPNTEADSDIGGGSFFQIGDVYAGATWRKSNHNMILTYGWLKIFANVVVYADCNNDIFGRLYKDIFIKQNTSEEDIIKYINITLNKFCIKENRSIETEALLHGLKMILMHMDLISLASFSNEKIQLELQQYHDDKSSPNRSWLRKMEFSGMLRDDDETRYLDSITNTSYDKVRAHIESGDLFTTQLTNEGFAIIRRIANDYEVY